MTQDPPTYVTVTSYSASIERKQDAISVFAKQKALNQYTGLGLGGVADLAGHAPWIGLLVTLYSIRQHFHNSFNSKVITYPYITV